MQRLRLWLILGVLAVIVLLIALPTLTGLLTDWWWYKEIGYQVVFTRRLNTEAVLLLAVGVIAFAILYGNFRLAQRGLIHHPIVLSVGGSAPQLDLTRGLSRLTLPVALVLALLAGFGATPLWDTVLQALNATPFGTTDPVFGRDVGWYVFKLPALTSALAVLMSLTVISLIAVLVIYLLRGDLAFRGRQARVSRPAALHLGLLVAAAFVLVALRLWLVDAPRLLWSTTGPLVGASYSDLHARLPALRLSALVALAGAALVVFGAVRDRLPRYTLYAVIAYAGVAILARGLYPAVLQKFGVAPTELTRESPYLRWHIDATRRAWGLDSVEVRDLGGEASLTLADIRANTATIENVRLWDRDPLLQTFGQLQEIRTYYDFVSVDDDRYWIDGKYRQVLLSPRELNPASLPTRTFINEHLTFTHGMGLTVGPVNQVTEEGLPMLFVKDLPPAATTASLHITRPQIYFGELNGDYAVVDTKQREFDYPSGDENVYAAYAGKAGVPVGSAFRRLVFSTRFASSNIFFSGDIGPTSRILYYRDIVERTEQALPFLRLDRDPYLVIAADGTLKWILDGYTVTSRYPYSERIGSGISYMRNSVKVVIDAYDGTVKAYVADARDPLLQTWARIFPGILLPLDSMGADLRAHLRVPDQLFRVQAALYATYHMDATEDFYHREDQWQIPTVNEATGAVPFMRHIILKLPGEQQAEYVYMVPFTPRGKDNLAAWMVARNDGAEYGKLRVYRMPRQSLVFGPTQIENRINQNTEISRQVSLWDQRGSQVMWGDLLGIPIGEALLYVQPLYLRAQGGKIPELKRVVAAYQNDVAMSETLDGALTDLFGGSSGVRGVAPSEAAAPAGAGAPAAAVAALRSLIAEARQRYQNAMEAQRAGDWARYGEEIRQLGALLERIGAGRQ